METSTEFRDEPWNETQWKTTLEIFKTTLLMCIFANPDKEKLQISFDDVGELYEFINGPRIAQSIPVPSLAKLKIMERKAWYNINLAMHKEDDLTLKSAIRQTIADHLFWTQELNTQQKRWTQEPYTPPKRQRNQFQQQQQDHWSPPSGKGQQGSPIFKQKGTTFAPEPTSPRAGTGKGTKSEGKGKGQGKSKGKGQGKTGKPPGKQGKSPGKRRYANVNPKNGKGLCVDWQWGKCKTNCGLSHVCSVIKPDGYTCLSAEHAAQFHED
jgi:hypothetical protein